MIPIVQREVDTFIHVIWNTHRIREQKETFLPDGVPNHIYSFPEKYGLEECGWNITEDQLEEVAELSRVLADNDDYLPADLRAKCEQVMADPLELDVADFANAFRFLKENVDL